MDIPTVGLPTPEVLPQPGWAGHHEKLCSLGPPWTRPGSQRAGGMSSRGWAGRQQRAPGPHPMDARSLLVSGGFSAISSI